MHFHYKVVNTQNNLKTTSIAYPLQQLLTQHLAQLSRSNATKTLVLKDCMSLELHIKTNGDDSSTPKFSKSINDIFKCLQLCGLPTPLGTHVATRPSIISASDLNNDQQAEQEPFDFAQQDPEPE